MSYKERIAISTFFLQPSILDSLLIVGKTSESMDTEVPKRDPGCPFWIPFRIS